MRGGSLAPISSLSTNNPPSCDQSPALLPKGGFTALHSWASQWKGPTIGLLGVGLAIGAQNPTSATHEFSKQQLPLQGGQYGPEACSGMRAPLYSQCCLGLSQAYPYTPWGVLILGATALRLVPGPPP